MVIRLLAKELFPCDSDRIIFCLGGGYCKNGNREDVDKQQSEKGVVLDYASYMSLAGEFGKRTRSDCADRPKI